MPCLNKQGMFLEYRSEEANAVYSCLSGDKGDMAEQYVCLFYLCIDFILGSV